MVRCRTDGLIYLNPRPAQDAIRDLHEQGWKGRPERFDQYRRKILEAEAEAIKSRKPAGGRLLDVGCATGTFFEFFSQPKWELHGLELSRANLRALSARRRAIVRGGTLREAAYPAEFFDVVSMIDMLYYVPDPRAELAEVQRILKRDGLLAVEIPGLNYRLFRNRGPVALLMSGRWNSFDLASGHLYYYSGRALRILLERTGFRVVRVHAERASLARGGVWRLINNLHFEAARLLMGISRGRLSIGGKELHLAVKTGRVGGDRHVETAEGELSRRFRWRNIGAGS